MKRIIYVITGCVMLFAACKPDKEIVENTKYEKLVHADPKYSYIKILNLSPGSPVVNFYMDGSKFSTRQSTNGIEGGYTYNQLFPDIGYAVTSPGTHALTGKIIPSAAADPTLEVFSANISPAAGKYYTIIPNGLYNPVAKKIPQFITLEDVRPALDTTKIFVRLVNILSGGVNTSLIRGTTNADPKIVNNIPVNGASDWAEISLPGGGPTPTLSFLFVDANTNAPIGSVVTFTGTTALIKGRAYTMYIRGITGTTGTNGPALSAYTTFY